MKAYAKMRVSQGEFSRGFQNIYLFYDEASHRMSYKDNRCLISSEQNSPAAGQAFLGLPQRGSLSIEMSASPHKALSQSREHSIHSVSLSPSPNHIQGSVSLRCKPPLPEEANTAARSTADRLLSARS